VIKHIQVNLYYLYLEYLLEEIFLVTGDTQIFYHHKLGNVLVQLQDKIKRKCFQFKKI